MANGPKLSPSLHIVDPTEDADDSSAAPKSEFREHDAITRKVRNPLVDGATPQTPPPRMVTVATDGPAPPPDTPAGPATVRAPSRSLGWASGLGAKRLILVGLAVVGLVVGVVLVSRPARKPPAGAPPAAPSATKETAAPPAAAAPLPEAPAAPRPAPASRPGNSHIDISVQPADATLALDAVTAEGNRIVRDVPRDDVRHVIEASSPGYEPFRKMVSFANDVYMDIELKRKPTAARGTTRARPPQPQPRIRNDVGAKSDVSAKPDVGSPTQNRVDDFGMTLERPAIRRSNKKIDEKDPYLP